MCQTAANFDHYSLDAKQGGIADVIITAPIKKCTNIFPIEASKIYLSSIKLFTAFILCGELCGEEERGLSNGSGKLKCPDFKLFD